MIHFVVVHDGPPLSDTHTDVPKLCDATKNVIVPFLDNAIHQIKEEDGDSSVCLVVDALALRAVEISQCYWIPKVIIWTSPIATYALIYDIPPLVSSQIIPSSQHLIIYDLVYALMDILWLLIEASWGILVDNFKMVKYFPTMSPIYSIHLPWVVRFSVSQQEFIFHFSNQYMERVREIDWVIYNSFLHLEDLTINNLVNKGALVYLIGPLIPSALLNSNSKEIGLEIRMGYLAKEGEYLDLLDKQFR